MTRRTYGLKKQRETRLSTVPPGQGVFAHPYPGVSAHVMRATETAHWLEWRDWGNLIIAEPSRV
jgi:hypothetical protein